MMKDQVAPTRRALGRASYRRSLLVALGALLLFGAWAVYANSGHGLAAQVVAAAAQGVLSFTTTMFASLLLEWLYHQCRDAWTGAFVAGLGTPVIGLGAMALVHVIVGTPEVIMTLIPSTISAFTVYPIYAVLLARSDGAQGPLAGR